MNTATRPSRSRLSRDFDDQGEAPKSMQRFDFPELSGLSDWALSAFAEGVLPGIIKLRITKCVIRQFRVFKRNFHHYILRSCQMLILLLDNAQAALRVMPLAEGWFAFAFLLSLVPNRYCGVSAARAEPGQNVTDWLHSAPALLLTNATYNGIIAFSGRQAPSRDFQMFQKSLRVGATLR
jgi:hypothetical protein